MKTPVLVAISNQKGGVGKSILTILLASCLHYLKEKNVTIVDCDYPQHSLSNLRDREVKVIEKSDELKKLAMANFKRINKKAYPIINSTADRGAQTAWDFRKDNAEKDFDVIFVDLPGTVNQLGLLETIVNMDYVITPIIVDRMVMQSSLWYTRTVHDFIGKYKDIPLKNIYFVWNRVNRRVSPELLNAYKEVIKEFDLSVLNTIIHEACRFDKELTANRREFFRSTLLPPTPSLLKGTNIEILADELCEVIKI